MSEHSHSSPDDRGYSRPNRGLQRAARAHAAAASLPYQAALQELRALPLPRVEIAAALAAAAKAKTLDEARLGDEPRGEPVAQAIGLELPLVPYWAPPPDDDPRRPLSQRALWLAVQLEKRRLVVLCSSHQVACHSEDDELRRCGQLLSLLLSARDWSTSGDDDSIVWGYGQGFHVTELDSAGS